MGRLGNGVVEDLLEDGLWGFPFGESLVGEADTVEANVFGEGEEIFGDGVVAAVDESAGTGGFQKGNAGAGGAAEFEIRVLAGAFDDVDDMFEEDFTHMNLVSGFHGVDEIFGGADRVISDEVKLGSGDGSGAFFLNAEVEVTPEDFLFFVGSGVSEPMAEHEAVELGLGEFEGAGLLNRVLGRDDEERGGEGEGFVSEGDLTLLHGFEEGTLDLWGGAVDLVGEEEICEDGTLVSPKLTGLLIEDLGAKNVGWEEVDRELDAAKIEVKSLGDGVDEEGLCQTGHAFQKKVAGGQKGDEGAFDDNILTDNDLTDTIADFLEVGGGVSY